jgi:large subunit ribosomal protein L22
MEIKVKLSNLRTAPRKVRQVIDLVRGKKVQEAQAILSFTVNKSGSSILKLLNSAIASAKNDFHLDEADLIISEITVDEGPKLKRWHPMSRGRAYPIIKRSAHIALIIKELNPAVKDAPKVIKTANTGIRESQSRKLNIQTKKTEVVVAPKVKKQTKVTSSKVKK